MKGQIRYKYPGGNTPYGFYSYYNYILPQRKAEKIFCLKGGPGTGKSTLMKQIGEYFWEKGESVDFLLCSSDPDSLDGIVLKERNIAVIDGTSPHIVDPKIPGVVDEIINLGIMWDEKGLRRSRRDIMKCSDKIAETFSFTYGYLRTVGIQYEFMAELLDKIIGEEQLYDAKKKLNMKLSSILAMRRAESKMGRESAMGIGPVPGKASKAFAGAITPAGIKNTLESLIEGLDKLILINVPVGFRTERLLSAAADRIVDAGFDIEEYYCPVDPERKLEHIICSQGKFAIISCNEYHRINSIELSKKVMMVDVEAEMEKNHKAWDVLEEVYLNSRENLNKALAYLERVREYHDELEGYYIPNMDFEKMKNVKEKIMEKILYV